MLSHVLAPSLQFPKLLWEELSRHGYATGAADADWVPDRGAGWSEAHRVPAIVKVLIGQIILTTEMCCWLRSEYYLDSCIW